MSWHNLRDWEGLYEINDENFQIRNVKTGKVLKTWLNDKGYYQLTLYNEGKKKIQPYHHRLIAKQFVPNIEDKPFIDHIDGCPTNNSLSNLRWVTHQENMRNVKPRGKSGVKGVIKYGNRFQVQTTGLDGKHKHHGTFKTIEEAAKVSLEEHEKLGFLDFHLNVRIPTFQLCENTSV